MALRMSCEYSRAVITPSVFSTVDECYLTDVQVRNCDWYMAFLCARLWRVDFVTRRVCDQLTGDELTVWRHDRVTSWLVAALNHLVGCSLFIFLYIGINFLMFTAYDVWFIIPILVTMPVVFKGVIPLIMAALCNRAGHYIFALWFLSFCLSVFFPRLISAATDWMSAILLHMAWP